MYKSFYSKFVKVVIDFFIAFCFIVLFCWLYLILLIIVKIDYLGAPAVFKQERIGKYGKIYKMYKFRTMIPGAENKGSGVYSDSNDDRVTRFGKLLRKTSLDELPQFFNILKGDMSLIGFRSPLTYHPWTWDKYTDEQKIMFEVRPGMTGWAQVHGRRTVKWDDRIKFNCWYAQNVKFSLDVKIFFKTIALLFTGKNNENLGKTI